MSEAASALEARARHWMIDVALGAGAALGVITIAHASLPKRPVPAPRAPVVAAAPAPPSHLIAFVQPVSGEEVVSPFGLRQLPWEENGRLHEGVDIAAEFGAPVLAAADGAVTAAGESSTYGRFVEIAHVEGLRTLYAHLGQLDPRMVPGVPVRAGATIGQIGSSGTSTGAHLHFEIRDARDRPLNPSLFLGQAFTVADDLPLRAARRFPRHVRIAYVSRIPESKKALMKARLEAVAAEDLASDASAQVRVVEGRPRATLRLARPPAGTAPAADPAPPEAAAPVEAISATSAD
ncbi:M23 family metallopeptidase [Phenylobacterium sp.]|uniref:M23 family metallopeptidase n=1 Tax=Phenylobacterium sp. TaxID=1871053 RepID=UPI0037846295